MLMLQNFSYSSEAMSILQDAPACCLPVFKFIEIYEKRYVPGGFLSNASKKKSDHV